MWLTAAPTESSELSTSKPLECREGFYREDPSSASDVCLPSCHSWLEYSKQLSIFIDVVIVLSALIGFVVAILVLVISILRRKRMYVN